MTNDDIFNNTIEKAESGNNSLNNTLIAQYEELNKKKGCKESLFSVNNIAKTLIPTIKKIIQSIKPVDKVPAAGKATNKKNLNDSSFLREQYINDLINEFEDEKSITDDIAPSAVLKPQTLNFQQTSAENILINKNQINASDNIKNMTSNSSKISSSLAYSVDKIPQSQPSQSIQAPPQKLQANNSSGGNNGNVVSKTNNPIGANSNADAAAPQKPKRTLKDMFSKAFNFSQSNNPNKKDVSQSRLAKLLQDSEAEPNSAASTQINKNPDFSKNGKTDKDKNNISEISIKNAKPNNNNFIDLNDENDNSNNNNNNDFKTEKKTKMNDAMKNFVFNIITDHTEDNYEFKPFYIKKENSNASSKAPTVCTNTQDINSNKKSNNTNTNNPNSNNNIMNGNTSQNQKINNTNINKNPLSENSMINELSKFWIFVNAYIF